MNSTPAMTPPCNGISLCYETYGDRNDPALVLIMGLGVQMLGWHEDLCHLLAAEGHFVVRFDNRDVGLSTHLDHLGLPDLQALSTGDTSSVHYVLDDMADDVMGLLDALGLESAHLVGASLGGMVAQQCAVHHPARVRSLTSIMSTTGDPSVGTPTEEALSVLLRPSATNRDEHVAGALRSASVIGSRTHPQDVDELVARAGFAYDRNYDPAGRARHLAAVLASGDRTPGLANVVAPTLVIHGTEDTLVQPSGGEATAKAVPGAELVVVEGMGHDLPRPLWPTYVELLSALVRRAEG